MARIRAQQTGEMIEDARTQLLIQHEKLYESWKRQRTVDRITQQYRKKAFERLRTNLTAEDKAELKKLIEDRFKNRTEDRLRTRRRKEDSERERNDHEKTVE